MLEEATFLLLLVASLGFCAGAAWARLPADHGASGSGSGSDSGWEESSESAGDGGDSDSDSDVFPLRRRRSINIDL